MKQREFEARHTQAWIALESQGAGFDARADGAERLPDQYRALCHHLAVARQRGYTPDLIQRLNALVLSIRQLVYRRSRGREDVWIRFVLLEFPRCVRESIRYVAVAGMFFLLPALVFSLGCWHNEDLIYSLLDAPQVRQLEQMYAPTSEALGRHREADTDAFMFAYYIRHNIGIAFQTFATGILVAIGPSIALVFNGAVLGAVAGHLAAIGYGGTFFPFVIAHAAFELPGIVLSGAAGLKLGFAWLVPGDRSRRASLRHAAGDGVRIVYGATAMLLIAAFLEAFWSSRSSIEPTVKYAVGGASWLVVFGYLTFCGRTRGARARGAIRDGS